MLFNDLNFIFVFLPVTFLTVLWVCPARFRPAALIAASLLFYGQSGGEHALVLVLCVLWVYAILDRGWLSHRRLRLVLAVAGPLCTLIYFNRASYSLS